MGCVGTVPLNCGLKTMAKTTKTQEGRLSGSNSGSSSSLLWKALGAKPRDKSFPREMGGWVIARAKHPEICDATAWPALLGLPQCLVWHSHGALRSTTKYCCLELSASLSLFVICKCADLITYVLSTIPPCTINKRTQVTTRHSRETGCLLCAHLKRVHNKKEILLHIPLHSRV